MKMETDVNRFRRIVRGLIRDNLKRFISSGELIGRQGGKQVTIPLPRIDLPRFQFGGNQQKGVGQGDARCACRRVGHAGWVEAHDAVASDSNRTA